MNPLTANNAVLRMHEFANPEKAAGMRRFFKTGPGEYAEGDRFLGLPNPAVRMITKEFKALALDEMRILLTNDYHEARCCALLLLVEQFRKGGAALRDTILSIYSEAARKYINNWDLVDLSAPGIVGEYELEHHSGVIEQFSEREILWEQRISVVSTLTLIRHGEFDLTFTLCEKFLTHKHDLMHKACGWMLREIGKRDCALLTSFLNTHRSAMPRTMLRYAIERYPEEQRREFLKK